MAPFLPFPFLFPVQPHKHGSSALQTFTANGLIIIEDEPKWLPDSQGCGPLRTILSEVKDVLVHLTIFPFETPKGLPALTSSAKENDKILSNATVKAEYMGSANVQALSALSGPSNPLCCDDDAVASGQGSLVVGSNNETNTMIVNGAFAPTFRMVVSGNNRELCRSTFIF